MQVIDIINHGRNNELILTQKDIPSPGDDEILIDIKASGVNRPDILQRFGLHPPPKGSPSHPGLEVSGIVKEIGCNVKSFNPGDKVMALLGGGGYAEFCVANQNLTIPMPENISFTEAAAIPETYFTVWNNVFRIGKLKENEKILIHGGSSGIGTTAIQMCKEFGATVITTTSDKNKEEKCYKIGADMVINYSKHDFVDIIEKSNYRNVDIILDIVGGDYTNRNFTIASMFARIIQIAYIKGSNVEIDLSQIMRKSLIHSGSVLRPKDLNYKSAIANDLKKNIMPIIKGGKLLPVIFKTFKLEDAYLAHELMKSGKHFGKIVLVE
jgi:putative PIG3 family NAD(P)H quinone oxidoreductase